MRRQAGLLNLAVRAAAAAAFIIALAGCGQAKIEHAEPVALSLISPSASSRVGASSITVAGTVKPRGERVLVAGRRVATSASGRFSIKVKLTTGTNLIDVIAGAPNARPAMTAVRVVRYVLVTVPSVSGDSPAQAAQVIRAAGLKPQIKGDPDPLSFLVPLSKKTCGQSPGAGTRVTPGSTVSVSTAKVCL